MSRGWCRLEIIAALCPKRFKSSGLFRPGPLNIKFRFHHDPESAGAGPRLTELEGQWVGAVKKNLEIESQCLGLEAECARLTDARRALWERKAVAEAAVSALRAEGVPPEAERRARRAALEEECAELQLHLEGHRVATSSAVNVT